MENKHPEDIYFDERIENKNGTGIPSPVDEDRNG